MSYRILSIDGGGIKGAFAASFLAAIEEQIKSPIGDYFDLIVGTSTGGILALGLGAQIPAKDILEFYEKDGPKIFRRQSFFEPVMTLFRSKYEGALLSECLGKRFNGKKLGDSVTRLVIPTFDLERGAIHLYKTAHHQKYERDYKELMATVAGATAAAPTYFPTFKTPTGVSFIDGGMWANNPVLVGAVEAVANLDWPRDKIKILSLGTTSSPLNIRENVGFWRGAGFWARRAPEVFLKAQSDGALAMAGRLVGSNNIVRVDPIVAYKRFDLDNVKELGALRSLGEQIARNELPTVREHFLNSPRSSFQPAHKLV